MIQIQIDGHPTPWAAHGGYGRRSFNPRYKEKEYAQWQIKAQYNRNFPVKGPVSLDISYHLPIPVRTSRVRKREMLAGRIHHISRPDVDNLNKFLCDALKTLVFEDDSQVVEICARKLYGENAKTIVRVKEVSSALIAQ